MNQLGSVEHVDTDNLSGFELTRPPDLADDLKTSAEILEEKALTRAFDDAFTKLQETTIRNRKDLEERAASNTLLKSLDGRDTGPTPLVASSVHDGVYNPAGEFGPTIPDNLPPETSHVESSASLLSTKSPKEREEHLRRIARDIELLRPHVTRALKINIAKGFERPLPMNAGALEVTNKGVSRIQERKLSDTVSVPITQERPLERVPKKEGERKILRGWVSSGLHRLIGVTKVITSWDKTKNVPNSVNGGEQNLLTKVEKSNSPNSPQEDTAVVPSKESSPEILPGDTKYSSAYEAAEKTYQKEKARQEKERELMSSTEKAHSLSRPKQKMGVIQRTKWMFNTKKRWEERRLKNQLQIDAELGDFLQDEDDDESIIKDLFDNPRNVAASAPKIVKPIQQTELPTAYLVAEEAYKLEKARQERLAKAREIVKERTRMERERVMKKVGPYGSKFLNMLDRGAEHLNKRFDKHTRLKMGIAVAAGGALALYAAPTLATVAVVSIAGAGVRTLSAAAFYGFTKSYLEKENSKRKEDGKEAKTALRMKGESAVAALAAIGAGQLAGQLIEWLYFPHAADKAMSVVIESPHHAVIPEVTAPIPSIPDISTVTAPPLVSVPEIPSVAPGLETLTPGISPTLLHHTLKPGEGLWSSLRTIMTTADYEGFKGLSDHAKELKILDVLGKIIEDPKAYGIPGPDINKIPVGTTIDYTKAFIK